MLTVVVALFMTVYVGALARAERGGGSALGAPAVAILLVLVGTASLGWWLDVPSQGRLLLAAALFFGPMIALPAITARVLYAGDPAALRLAPLVAASLAGLVAGTVLAVFGVGSW